MPPTYRRKLPKRVRNLCDFCDQRTSKKESVRLHAIPERPDLRAKWIKVLNLSPKDDVSALRICTRHFAEKDLYPRQLGPGVCLNRFLLSSAVPTRNLKGLKVEFVSDTETAANSDINISEDARTLVPEDNVEVEEVNKQSQQRAETEVQKPEELPIPPLILLNKFIKVPELIKIPQPGIPQPEIPQIEIPEPEILVENVNSNQINNGNDSKDIIVETECISCKNRPYDPWAEELELSELEPKRRNYAPRYITELKTMDFCTPDKARRTIAMIQAQAENQLKKIKGLNVKIRRLNKKCNNLQQVAKTANSKKRREEKLIIFKDKNEIVVTRMQQL